MLQNSDEITSLFNSIAQLTHVYSLTQNFNELFDYMGGYLHNEEPFLKIIQGVWDDKLSYSESFRMCFMWSDNESNIFFGSADPDTRLYYQGVWVVNSNPVPIPGGLCLFTAGLLGLAGFRSMLSRGRPLKGRVKKKHFSYNKKLNFCFIDSKRIWGQVLNYPDMHTDPDMHKGSLKMKKNLLAGAAAAFLIFCMTGVSWAELVTIGTAQFGGEGPSYKLIWAVIGPLSGSDQGNLLKYN